jgi:iron complex outermembrane receptor protein
LARAGSRSKNRLSVGAFSLSHDSHQSFDNVSPEATLTRKESHYLTLYAAYKTGYESGGFSNSAILSTGASTGDLQFKPETSKGFEIGVKSLLFNDQLRLKADVFDFLYSNLQVDFFNTQPSTTSP